MKKYRFDYMSENNIKVPEKDHIVLANSLSDAIEKFVRKNDLEPPAYWDEPTFDRNMELIFKNRSGSVKYHVSW